MRPEPSASTTPAAAPRDASPGSSPGSSPAPPSGGVVRSIAALIAGMVVMMITVALVQWIGHSIYPPPPGMDPSDRTAMIALISTMPLGALAMVLLAYAGGSFLGAGTATAISRRHKRVVALAIGVVMLALVAINFAIIPHPIWMIVLGLLVPVPFALLGYRVFR